MTYKWVTEVRGVRGVGERSDNGRVDGEEGLLLLPVVGPCGGPTDTLVPVTVSVDESVLSVRLVVSVLSPCPDTAAAGDISLGAGVEVVVVLVPRRLVTVAVVVADVVVLRPFTPGPCRWWTSL